MLRLLGDLDILEPKLYLQRRLDIQVDRIIALEEIYTDECILGCDPILTYFREQVDDIPALLRTLTGLFSSRIDTLVEQTTSVYPRTKKDIRRYLNAIYKDTIHGDVPPDDIEQMLLRPEQVILTKILCSSYQSKGKWYLFIEPSKINHSCNPNCLWWIHDGMLIIGCARTIQPGEELTVGYAPLDKLDTGRIRRNTIMQFGFYCACEICQDRCHTCDVPKRQEELQFCAQCKAVPYCSKECQKRDWNEHKNLCRRVRL